MTTVRNIEVLNDRKFWYDGVNLDSCVNGGANVLIFPNLSASNIAYNLVKTIANIEKIGPVLMGLKKPVHLLQLGSTTREIVNMIAIAVVDAQVKS